MLSKENNSNIMHKSNHYQIKGGKLVLRDSQQTNKFNYRWIPLASYNKPNQQDYYKQTVRRLQNQVNRLKAQIGQKQQMWGQQNIEKYYKETRQYQQTIRNLENRIKDRQLELERKQNQLRIKQTELWEKDLEINKINQELSHKDNLIKYQLSVVDRLIEQIQQKQIQQEEQQQDQEDQENNQYYQTARLNCHGSQGASSYRGPPTLLSQEIIFRHQGYSDEIEFKSICSKIQEDFEGIEDVEYISLKGQDQRSTVSTGQLNASKELSSGSRSVDLSKGEAFNNLKNIQENYSSSFLTQFLQTQTKSVDPAAGSLNGIVKLINKFI